MGIFLRILIGIAIVALGAFMVIRTRKLLEFFGPVAWADAHLGGGGSNLFYKFLGIFLCFIGFMVATNLWTAFLEATLGSLFGFNREPGL
ncbi:MAG: hypothetical protein WC787_03690 [Patescibacteria group bacterium]|jgi:hypothetical protein